MSGLPNNNSFQHQNRILVRDAHPFLCFAFYVFIFFIPFETLNIGPGFGNFTLSKLFGFIFLGLACLQPRVCFQPPKPAFFYFAVYLLVYVILGMIQEERFERSIILYFVTFLQLLVLFWVSQNLMINEGITKRALLIFGISCFCLALLVLSGVLRTEIAQNRVTAAGLNANSYAALLSLGLLALIGLAGNQRITNYKIRGFAWFSFSVLAVAIVQSGSRSSMAALLVAFCVLMFKGRGLKVNPKVLLVLLLAIGFIVAVIYQSEAVRVRWERTIMEGGTSGRGKIHSRAMDMFVEKPLQGWGPTKHYFELGSRVGKPTRDPHSIYFWVLLEVGLLGAIPFFVGLALVFRGAWKARSGVYGQQPLAMLLFILLISFHHSYHQGKVFWLVLAYAVASESLVRSPERVKRFSKPSVAASP